MVKQLLGCGIKCINCGKSEHNKCINPLGCKHNYGELVLNGC